LRLNPLVTRTLTEASAVDNGVVGRLDDRQVLTLDADGASAEDRVGLAVARLRDPGVGLRDRG